VIEKTYINDKEDNTMPWPRKHRPRSGRRKIGSKKRLARRKSRKK